MKLSMRFCMLLFPVLIALSCTREPGIRSSAGGGDQGETLATFSLQLPAQVVATRSVVGTDQENFVDDIYLLAFRKGADGKDYFSYAAQGAGITDNVTSNYKKFSATVYKRSYPQHFVLIANAHDEVRKLNLGDTTQVKEVMLTGLEFSNTESWFADSGQSFVPIPMWGETEAKVIDDNSSFDIVKVTRMVSRLDVHVGPGAQQDFEITDVRFYNYVTDGRIVPDLTDGYWNPTDNKAILPTVPSSGGNRVKGPFVYDADTSGEVPSFYAFESPAVDMSRSSEAATLVIGGKYGDDDKTTYYKVDFLEKDGSGTVKGYKNLLRNHYYRFNITSVGGSGYTGPDEAFEAKSENMQIEVKEWDLGDISEIVVGDQYVLGVSQGLFEIPKPKNEYTFLVHTDYEKGWKIDPSWQDYDWITSLEGEFLEVNEKEPVTFTVTANNSGGSRTAYIYITAGRLSYKVTIVQTIENLMELTVTDAGGTAISEMVFLSEVGESYVQSKSFKVNWNPGERNVMVAAAAGSPAFEYADGVNPFSTVEINGGTETYMITPPPFKLAEVDEKQNGNPFLEKSVIASFVLPGGDASQEPIARTVTLRQIHYDLLAYPSDEGYSADGETYNFTVKSNAPWRAQIIDGEGIIIERIVTVSGAANTAGIPFRFQMCDCDKTGATSGTFTVRFWYQGEYDPQERYKDYVVDMVKVSNHQEVGESNAYMVKPGSDGISIPVSQANADGVTTRIGAADALSAEVLWLDANTGIGPNSIIESYAIDGTGSSAWLNVKPGTKEGNAVIAVRNSEGICWSWHIWVTDYDPLGSGKTYTYNSITWMDRNLGALTDARAEAGNFGFYYQWGRKDPFPGPVSKALTGFQTVYKTSGTPTGMEDLLVTESDNLEQSIKNPTVFYRGIDGNAQDWYGTSARNDYLWDGVTKTAYDPCPLGWKLCYQDWDNSVFKDLSYTGFWQSAGGVYWSQVGFFPAMGMINTSGQLTGASSGMYWWATFNGDGAFYWPFTNANPGFINTHKRGNGMPVRCVKQ